MSPRFVFRACMRACALALACILLTVQHPALAQSDPAGLARAINQAGRQRMLSQRIVKLYCQLVMNVAPGTSRSELAESIALFERQLGDLEASARTPEKSDPGAFASHVATREVDCGRHHRQRRRAPAARGERNAPRNRTAPDPATRGRGGARVAGQSLRAPAHGIAAPRQAVNAARVGRRTAGAGRGNGFGADRICRGARAFDARTRKQRRNRSRTLRDRRSMGMVQKRAFLRRRRVLQLGGRGCEREHPAQS